MSKTVALVRPYSIDEQFHRDRWIEQNITVLITQRKTYDITRLSIESLLRFYPDIPILAVDGESNDDSLLYLKWKEITVPNFKLWERKGHIIGKFTSHGVTLNEAIQKFITTKYVLLMDSDVIIERGGFIEGMLAELRGTDNAYATGTLMEVSNSNDAVGNPKDENDILLYAHPSLSLLDVGIYKKLRPAADHGSPLCYNMQDAQQQGYKVTYFPVDRYALHCSGASWCNPRTVWNHDHNVFLRPFITFLGGFEDHLAMQTSNDFEMITALKEGEGHVILHENLIDVDLKGNRIFSSRFNIRGEYVCFLPYQPPPDLVYLAKLAAIEQKAPDTFKIGDIEFIRRKLFQNKTAFGA